MNDRISEKERVELLRAAGSLWAPPLNPDGTPVETIVADDYVRIGVNGRRVWRDGVLIVNEDGVPCRPDGTPEEVVVRTIDDCTPDELRDLVTATLRLLRKPDAVVEGY